MNKVTIELDDSQLQIVLNAMGQRPYAEVAQVVQLIAQQIQAQRKPTAVPSPEDASAEQ